MQENLLRFKDKQKYILFDLETESLNLVSSNYNKPFQVGYVIGEGKNIVHQNSHMIKWDKLNITPGAAKVTKFDKKKYEANAEDPNIILDEIEQYIYNNEYLILGQNLLQFDVYILKIWQQLLNRQKDYSYVNRLFDTNALLKAIKLNIQPAPGDNLLAFQYRMLNKKVKGLKTNLTTVGTEYGINFDPDNLHDAEKDCELNWAIWNKVVWQIEI